MICQSELRWWLFVVIPIVQSRSSLFRPLIYCAESAANPQELRARTRQPLALEERLHPRR